MDYDLAVIGAGVGGLSIAAGLSPDMKTVVLEREDMPGYHTSGRSAATLAMSYGNQTILELTSRSFGFYANPPASFTDVPLLTPRERLLVATRSQRDLLLSKLASYGEGTELLEKDAILSAYKFFNESYIDCAVADKRGGDLDVHEIMQGYLRELRANAGVLRPKFGVAALKRKNGVWEIVSDRNERVTAKLLVNAAGAWADEVGGLAGLPPIGLQPFRRSACLVPLPDGYDAKTFPFVIDADEQFYFKPESGQLMVSPADETPSPPTDAQPEEIDIAIAVERFQAATNIPVTKISHRWAGLRTFAPDRAPVAGFDPLQEDFFWFAGQGGYGFQIAPGFRDFAVALVQSGHKDRDLQDVLTPSRFRS